MSIFIQQLDIYFDLPDYLKNTSICVHQQYRVYNFNVKTAISSFYGQFQDINWSFCVFNKNGEDYFLIGLFGTLHNLSACLAIILLSESIFPLFCLNTL